MMRCLFEDTFSVFEGDSNAFVNIMFSLEHCESIHCPTET